MKKIRLAALPLAGTAAMLAGCSGDQPRRPNVIIIYADDIGEYNISMYGEGDYVLPVGEKLGYELVSNNEVKIKDGFFITQGRRGLIKKGSTESCAIENGTQDEKRNDLIVIEYAKDGDYTLFFKSLERVIKARGSVSKFAEEIDLNRSNLCNILKGKVQPSFDTTMKILRGLGADIEVKFA